MYPIAMGAVDRTGADRVKMAYAVMLAASDYMTSFGYQTNLMVYAPGGYKNLDYLKFGTPLQTILWLSSAALLVSSSTWYVSWVICFCIFAGAAAIRLGLASSVFQKKSSAVEKSSSSSEAGSLGSLHAQRKGVTNFYGHEVVCEVAV